MVEEGEDPLEVIDAMTVEIHAHVNDLMSLHYPKSMRSDLLPENGNGNGEVMPEPENGDTITLVQAVIDDQEDDF